MEIYFTILCIIELCLCPEFQCSIKHVSHYSFQQLSTLKPEKLLQTIYSMSRI